MATNAAQWPASPVPDTAEWAARCLARLLSLDPELARDEAVVIADDMSTRRHWRHMLPETAAEILFMPVAAIRSSGSEGG
ncbi:MAG TPA: hypothetical protein VJN68_09855 [Burkholderiaceae bacterium]|nr:hypothetical protein [Burkholderiaceae bacterium]